MSKKTSISHEFYKVQEYWNTALLNKQWKLAIWVAEYQDIEIISSFIDIERTALGETKEMLFKFNSIYTTTHQEFEQNLWNEFILWFKETPEERYDMHAALLKDGYLKEPFYANQKLAPTIQNLINEIERFRSELRVDDLDFIIEFSIGMHHEKIGHWFYKFLELEIPKAIRFVTIDIASKRLIKNFSNKSEGKYLEIFPKLDMVNATKNEMKKEAQGVNPNVPASKYQQTVLQLMEVLPNKKKIPPLIDQLFEEAKIIDTPSVITSTYLIIAHVYNTIQNPKEGLDYIEQGITSTEVLKKSDTPEQWYPLWRSCMLFKAAFLFGLKEDEKAFECYEAVATQATQEKDHFYIMESYRLCATIKLKRKKYTEAFEYGALSLYSGSFLPEDIRRQSTYLYAANIAYNTVKYLDEPMEKQMILEDHLIEWIGKDWQKLIYSDEDLNAHYNTPEIEELIKQ